MNILIDYYFMKKAFSHNSLHQQPYILASLPTISSRNREIYYNQETINCQRGKLSYNKNSNSKNSKGETKTKNSNHNRNSIRLSTKKDNKKLQKQKNGAEKEKKE